MITTAVLKISPYTEHAALMVGAVLPPDIAGEMLQWAIALMVGFWLKGLLATPEQHGKRISDMEKEQALNKQADEIREKQMVRIEKLLDELLKALAQKV
jgi:hypothetical protein